MDSEIDANASLETRGRTSAPVLGTCVNRLVNALARGRAHIAADHDLTHIDYALLRLFLEVENWTTTQLAGALPLAPSSISRTVTKLVDRGLISPNPPMDTDGRRENSGRGVRELPGRWPGLHWGRWEVGEGSSVVAPGPYGRLRTLGRARWRGEDAARDARTGWRELAGTLGWLAGQWRTGAVRPGVESLAAGRGRG